MENQNSSYSVQIGKTTFIVCVKQSETAKKPIEKMFKDMCRHEVTRDFLALAFLRQAGCRSGLWLAGSWFPAAARCRTAFHLR